MMVYWHNALYGIITSYYIASYSYWLLKVTKVPLVITSDNICFCPKMYNGYFQK